MADNKKSKQTTEDRIAKALKSRYRQSQSELSVLSQQELQEFLSTLPKESTEIDNEAPVDLVDLTTRHQPERCLDPENYALLSFLDECFKESFAQAHLDRTLELLFYNSTPAVAIKALKNGLVQTITDHPIVSVLDLLIEHCIGWTNDLGKAGNSVLEKVQSTLSSLSDPATDYQALLADLEMFFDKEQQRIRKLEGRIADSEAGILRAQRAQNLIAQMLNAEMKDNQLPLSISEFLQGPWCDSLQLMLIQHGIESDQWQRACKITETLIWTLQPVELEEIEEEDEKAEQKEAKNEETRQRLYRIIEHLPNEIHELLVALKHHTDKAEAALSDIEMEHIKIMSGQKPVYKEFTLLDCEEDLFSGLTTISKSLLNRVSKLEPGQWFFHEDGRDQATRIKLALKLDDIHQLLFTNRNGLKALQKSFEEFAYHLSSAAAKPLTSKAVISSTLKATLQQIVSEHQIKRKKLQQAKQQSVKEQSAKEAARIKELEEAKALAIEKQAAEKKRAEKARQEQLQSAREEAEKAENVEKLQAAKERVQSLNANAWLKLPDSDGSLLECKLVVKLAAADKFIFANRSGIKTGEFSADQLAQLLATDNAEILDEGAEFEDTLAKVVTGLRQDRNKSYDDLSGQ